MAPQSAAIVATISLQRCHDRGSIVPRSRFDRTAIMEFFHEASPPSDQAQVSDGPDHRRSSLLLITIISMLFHRPFDEDRTDSTNLMVSRRSRSSALMEIGWSWCRHNAKEIGFSTDVGSRSCGIRADDDPTLLMSPRGIT